MDLKVEQGCPQCGAPVTLAETDRLLTCPYCGVKNFLQTAGNFRYVLPDKVDEAEQSHIIHAPYIRLKSNLFTVSEKGISYRVIDTTQSGHPLRGMPPSLGVRPQAMTLSRVTPKTSGKFLPLSIKAKIILEKAIQLSQLGRDNGRQLFHRAFIGDTLSLIYLPMLEDETNLLDGVTRYPLAPLERLPESPLKGRPFNPRWQVRFLPTLCPQCGWSLDGEADCIVLTCRNCDTAWEIGDRGLTRMDWLVQPGDSDTALHLAFWRMTAQVPALQIASFADFIQRTNQPMVPKPQWHNREMQFWIPAFKLRPKIFLRTARQVTVGQWRLEPKEGHSVPNLYPVTLPRSEARQALKITLAASATSPKDIFPFLPETRIGRTTASLVFLPFVDRGHDWVQPQTRTVIDKNILRFGRKL